MRTDGPFEIDPSQLRPGTVALRRLVLADKEGHRLVRQVESWCLHRCDLENVLTTIAHLLDPGWPHEASAEDRACLREVALAGAVVRYFRCFDSDARKDLQAEQVFRNERGGLIAHRYWKKLRDGTVVHDSNPWIDSQVLAEVGADGRALGTYLLAVFGSGTDEAHLRYLGNAAHFARQRVVNDLESIQAELHRIVVRLDPGAVALLPAVVYTAPGADKARDRR